MTNKEYRWFMYLLKFEIPANNDLNYVKEKKMQTTSSQ